jgi:GAF domain-containing protein
MRSAVTENQIHQELSLPGMLQDMVLDSDDVNEFLDGLVKLAADTLSHGNREILCGIVLLRPRTKTTVASSSERAQLMDEVQYPFDDGPCLRAAWEGQVYSVSDFRSESRFGDYPRAIAAHGMRSGLGVPIPLDGLASAGLNFYSPQHHAFDEQDIAAAVDFAREASKTLRMAVRVAHLSDTKEQMQAAMSSRTVIDLAAGIIMGQSRCSHEAAMTILKAASSGRNKKLADVAATVVTSIGQRAPDTHFDS